MRSVEEQNHVLSIVLGIPDYMSSLLLRKRDTRPAGFRQRVVAFPFWDRMAWPAKTWPVSAWLSIAIYDPSVLGQ